jgi:hypothetical protein
MTKQRKDDGRRLLLQYAGIGMEITVGLVAGIFAGRWLDKKMASSVAVFSWLLPLLILLVIFWKVIKDTSKK